VFSLSDVVLKSMFLTCGPIYNTALSLVNLVQVKPIKIRCSRFIFSFKSEVVNYLWGNCVHLENVKLYTYFNTEFQTLGC
jgi:hypothetical protein